MNLNLNIETDFRTYFNQSVVSYKEIVIDSGIEFISIRNPSYYILATNHKRISRESLYIIHLRLHHFLKELK